MAEGSFNWGEGRSDEYKKHTGFREVWRYACQTNFQNLHALRLNLEALWHIELSYIRNVQSSADALEK